MARYSRTSTGSFVRVGPFIKAHRSLWYHPESDCYVECLSSHNAYEIAKECMEVTGDPLAEANFRLQRNLNTIREAKTLRRLQR